MCVCVRECARERFSCHSVRVSSRARVRVVASVRACVCVYACVRVRARVCACVCLCVSLPQSGFLCTAGAIKYSAVLQSWCGGRPAGQTYKTSTPDALVTFQAVTVGEARQGFEFEVWAEIERKSHLHSLIYLYHTLISHNYRPTFFTELRRAESESGDGRPELLVPNSPYGLCGRKATLNLNLFVTEPAQELRETLNSN